MTDPKTVGFSLSAGIGFAQALIPVNLNRTFDTNIGDVGVDTTVAGQDAVFFPELRVNLLYNYISTGGKKPVNFGVGLNGTVGASFGRGNDETAFLQAGAEAELLHITFYLSKLLSLETGLAGVWRNTSALDNGDFDDIGDVGYAIFINMLFHPLQHEPDIEFSIRCAAKFLAHDYDAEEFSVSPDISLLVRKNF